MEKKLKSCQKWEVRGLYITYGEFWPTLPLKNYLFPANPLTTIVFGIMYTSVTSESWKHCTSNIFSFIRQELCYCLVSDFDGFVECVLNGGVVCVHKLTLEIEAVLRIQNGIIPKIESGSTFLNWPGPNPKAKSRSDQRCRSNNIGKNIIIFSLY